MAGPRRLVSARARGPARPPPPAAPTGRRGGASAVVVVGGDGRHVLTRSPGVLEGLAWSPDRRRLLVGWPTGDGWLFLPVGGGSPLVVTELAGDFGGDFPRVLGWKGE